MQMEITKEFEVEQNINKTWAFLSDPEKVVTCVPGAKITELLDERNFNGVVEVKIGPIMSRYQGKATLDVKDDENYLLSLVGNGLDSKGQGSATMAMKGNLTKIDENKTKVDSTMTVNISGKVAQLGSRMIKAVSNQMFEQFRDNFITSLNDPDFDYTQVENKPIKGINLVMGTIGKKLTSPFRKSSSGEDDSSSQSEN